MPPSRQSSIATRDTIASLWAAASSKGEVTIRLPSFHACIVTRNKLQSHRAALRRQAQAHTGFAATAYDKFKVLYRQEIDFNLYPTGHWLLQITPNDYLQFELLPDRRSERSAINPNTPTEQEQEQEQSDEEIEENCDPEGLEEIEDALVESLEDL